MYVFVCAHACMCVHTHTQQYYIHKVPITSNDDPQHESHKPYGLTTSVTIAAATYPGGILTPPLILPFPEAGDFVGFIWLCAYGTYRCIL